MSIDRWVDADHREALLANHLMMKLGWNDESAVRMAEAIWAPTRAAEVGALLKKIAEEVWPKC